MVRVLQVTLFLIVTTACSQQECIDYPSVEMKEVPVNRLEQAFGVLKTKEEIKAYLDQHPDLKNGFLLGQQYPDTFMVDYLHQVNTTPASDTLYNECMATFGDFTPWRQQFEQAQSLLIHYYPDEKVRTVNTFIPGLMRDLYVNDENIFIGIDYFLGPKASFRPQNYQYVLKRYTPETVAPMTMLYLAGKFNQSDLADNSMLAEMVFYGKSLYFCKSLLPCVPDSTIIGYTSEEWEGSEEHISQIWAHFVEKELLFINGEREKQRYVGERPSVPEIGNKCPGRIGRWLGWKIVNAYMENHPELTLPDLMATPNAKVIFEGSKFKP